MTLEPKCLRLSHSSSVISSLWLLKKVQVKAITYKKINKEKNVIIEMNKLTKKKEQKQLGEAEIGWMTFLL